MAKKANFHDQKTDLLHCIFCDLLDATYHLRREDGELLYWCEYKHKCVIAYDSCDHCEPNLPPDGPSNVRISFRQH